MTFFSPVTYDEKLMDWIEATANFAVTNRSLKDWI
jgi:hypothetical protein